MMKQLRPTVAGLALLASLGFAGTAQADFVNQDGVANPFGGAVFTPNVGSVDLATSFFSTDANNDVPNQSPASITTLVNSLLAGLTPPEGPLTLVGCADSGVDEGCTNNVTVTGGGTTSGSVSDGSFVYAAIHAGTLEYLVEFSQPVTSFTFTNLGKDFSNVRLLVPLPGAALLFGSALAGLAWLRRRRDAGALDAPVVAA